MPFKFALALLLLLPLAAPAAQRGGSSSKKAVQEEVDPAVENLGKALAGALEDSLEALENFRDTAQELDRRKISRNKALSRFAEDRDRMARAIERGRDAKPAEGAGAAKDVFLVAASQGLKGMDLYMEGVKEGDSDKEEKGQKLGELAEGDLSGLAEFDPESGYSGGGGGGGGGGEVLGRSFGMNGSASFASSSTNGNFGVNYSQPITDSVDIGTGVSLGVNASSSGSGAAATVSGSMTYGVNAFMRKHFLQAIEDKPWMVPFLGVVGNMNLNSDLTDSASSSATLNTSVGMQLGMLVFTNRNTAMNFQVEYDVNASDSSSSASTSSNSTSSLVLSVGLRYML